MKADAVRGRLRQEELGVDPRVVGTADAAELHAAGGGRSELGQRGGIDGRAPALKQDGGEIGTEPTDEVAERQGARIEERGEYPQVLDMLAVNRLGICSRKLVSRLWRTLDWPDAARKSQGDPSRRWSTCQAAVRVSRSPSRKRSRSSRTATNSARLPWSSSAQV